MDPKLSATFKARLLAQRKALQGQLATLRGGDIGRAEASAEHFGQPQDSRAQVSTERELELALDERETTELLAVDAALQRIADGSYGECTGCGTDIPAARLHAAPEAPRCVACQEKTERAQALPGMAA